MAFFEVKKWEYNGNVKVSHIKFKKKNLRKVMEYKETSIYSHMQSRLHHESTELPNMFGGNLLLNYNKIMNQQS
jgi:hypothetical protein